MAGTVTASVPPQVLTVGETMGCLVLGDDPDSGAVTFIGAETNVAIGLSLLGHRARWVSRLGEDRLGDQIAGRLREYGVDPWVTRDPDRQTGLAVKEIGSGRTMVRYYRSGSAASAMSTDDIPPLAAEWLHLTGITSALSGSCADLVRELLRRAREQRVRISIDINLRPALWGDLSRADQTLRSLCASADLLLIGEDESRLLGWGATMEEFRARVPVPPDAVVVFKRGAHGAQACAAGVVYAAPALPTEVVDLTGAGDAFAAGFLSGQLRGRSIPECLRLGTGMAAEVIGVETDFLPAPDPDRRARLLRLAEAELEAEAGVEARSDSGAGLDAGIGAVP